MYFEVLDGMSSGCELISSKPVSVLAHVSLAVKDTELIVGGGLTTIVPESTWTSSYTFNIPSDSLRYSFYFFSLYTSSFFTHRKAS
mgnify:CR=1 FL=1